MLSKRARAQGWTRRVSCIMHYYQWLYRSFHDNSLMFNLHVGKCTAISLQRISWVWAEMSKSAMSLRIRRFVVVPRLPKKFCCPISLMDPNSVYIPPSWDIARMQFRNRYLFGHRRPQTPGDEATVDRRKLRIPGGDVRGMMLGS